MELKEYIKIFKKRWKLFVGVVVSVLVIGVLIQSLLPIKYKVNVDLNITRIGYQKNTNGYRYDEFYRLQADERFADTVVRWLESDRVKIDISNDVRVSSFEKIKARRLSSQMISVNFLIREKRYSEKIVNSMAKILDKKTMELNKYQQDPNWFKILISQPTVSDHRLSFGKLILILLLSGIFIGTWVVFIKHYFNNEV